MRWFLLPFEARQILCSGETFAIEPPFRPLEYPDGDQTLLRSVGEVGSYGRHYSVDEQIIQQMSSPRNQNLDAFKTKVDKIRDKSKTKANSKAENNGESDIKKECGVENGTPTCDSGLCVLSGERGPPQTVHGVFEPVLDAGETSYFFVLSQNSQMALSVELFFL